MSQRLNLSSLLKPNSVAIVGASERPGSLGAISWANLIQMGYQGEVFLINPRYDRLNGQPCYPNLRALPRPVDSVIACVPSQALPDMLAEAVASGACSAVLYASGFAETGPAGQALQAEIKRIASDGSLVVCGPNCLGLVNVKDQYASYSAPLPANLKSGRIAAVTQSGSVAIALLNSGRGLDFSYVVSSGNEAVVTVEDYLSFFVDDEHTDVILAFVEGFRKPDELRRAAARAAALDKPLIVLKVGRSEVAQRSVMAHTGSLAGSDAIQAAFFAQHGIIRVATLDEMLETAALFADVPRPKGDKLGVTAISGGEVGLLADLARDEALEFAALAEPTQQRLRELLPPFCHVANPLDAWGLGDLGDTYARCLEALAQDPGVDLLVVCQDAQAGLAPGQVGFYQKLAHSVVRARQGLEKPLILFSNLSGGLHPELRAILAAGRVPALQGTVESLRAIRHLIEFARFRRQAQAQTSSTPRAVPQSGHIPAAWLEEPVLSEHMSRRVLEAFGIRVVRGHLAQSPEEAVALAAQIGYPVALKINSPDIPHKTDVGGVRLNIADSTALQAAYAEVLGNVRRQKPAARLDGLLVQAMLDLSQAVELIAGVKHDPLFGPTVLLGLGGVLVEVLQDVVVRVAPLSEADAWSMVNSLRAAAWLQGARGRPPVDRAAVVDVLLRLSDLATTTRDRLEEVDVNPLVVFPEGRGALAADALVLTRPVSAAQAVSAGHPRPAIEERRR